MHSQKTEGQQHSSQEATYLMQNNIGVRDNVVRYLQQRTTTLKLLLQRSFDILDIAHPTSETATANILTKIVLANYLQNVTPLRLTDESLLPQHDCSTGNASHSEDYNCSDTQPQDDYEMALNQEEN